MHITSSYNAVKQNLKHAFAMRHSLVVYQSNSIYSFIPKNACSTLRLSLAKCNGTLDSVEDFNWIHNNNETFAATLRDLLVAQYSFVVLRCPYARALSAFLDKIVGLTPEAWAFHALTNREVVPTKVTFEFFVRSLRSPMVRSGNIHWRPQKDFLVYKDYDDYFSVERFVEAEIRLKEKIGFSVVDARELTTHGTSHLERFEQGPESSKIEALDLLNLRERHKAPRAQDFYTDELRSIIRTIYADDFELYKNRLSNTDLMFPD